MNGRLAKTRGGKKGQIGPMLRFVREFSAARVTIGSLNRASMICRCDGTASEFYFFRDTAVNFGQKVEQTWFCRLLSSTNDLSDLFSCEERTFGTFRVPDRQVRKRSRSRPDATLVRTAQHCKGRLQDVNHRLRRQVFL